MNNTINVTAIELIVKNLGKENLMSLLDTISEVQKIVQTSKPTTSITKYVLCVQKTSKDTGEVIYHPITTSGINTINPTLMYSDSIVRAQLMASDIEKMTREKVYVMPVTNEKYNRLIQLLKKCNQEIEHAITVSANALHQICPNVSRMDLADECLRKIMDLSHSCIGNALDYDGNIRMFNNAVLR